MPLLAADTPDTPGNRQPAGPWNGIAADNAFAGRLAHGQGIGMGRDQAPQLCSLVCLGPVDIVH
jgi:hypothetical protein